MRAEYSKRGIAKTHTNAMYTHIGARDKTPRTMTGEKMIRIGE
jgi:hypothetical protein